MDTRRVQHADGRVEIIRVLDPDALDALSFKDPVSYEQSIVWLEDISQIDEVQVALVRCCTSRTGPLTLGGVGKLVGYSKLTSNAPPHADTNFFTRRIFFISDGNKEIKVTNRHLIPAGSIDPKQVLPGISGVASTEEIKRSRFDG